MRSLLLDTTILIDIERHGAELDAVIADTDDVAVAAITAAELHAGTLLADSHRRHARSTFVDALLDQMTVITYDLRIAQSHGELLAWTRQSGRPRSAHDLIIAATAHATRRVVVTTDQRGFIDLPNVDVITVTRH